MSDAEILATVAALAGGACHSATGFGFALVVAPLAVAALPPETAVATVLLLGALTSLLTLTTERRLPSPLWGESARLVAYGALGAVVGALVLERLDRTALQLLVSATVVGALGTRAIARRKAPGPAASRRWLAPAGLASGVLTTTTSANGPPLLLYLFGRRVSAGRMRDTLSVLFVSFGLIGLAAIAASQGELPLPDGGVLVALAGAAAAGHVAGRPLFARLAAGRYEQVVGGLLLISVLAAAAIELA